MKELKSKLAIALCINQRYRKRVKYYKEDFVNAIKDAWIEASSDEKTSWDNAEYVIGVSYRKIIAIYRIEKGAWKPYSEVEGTVCLCENMYIITNEFDDKLTKIKKNFYELFNQSPIQNRMVVNMHDVFNAKQKFKKK